MAIECVTDCCLLLPIPTTRGTTRPTHYC